MKNSFFGFIYYGKNLALINKDLAFLPVTFTGIFIKRTLICYGGKYNLSYPIKQSVPHLSDLVLLLKTLAFFYSVVAVLRSAVAFT
jgi:uncharacterized membrane protein SirB2